MEKKRSYCQHTPSTISLPSRYVFPKFVHSLITQSQHHHKHQNTKGSPKIVHNILEKENRTRLTKKKKTLKIQILPSLTNQKLTPQPQLPLMLHQLLQYNIPRPRPIIQFILHMNNHHLQPPKRQQLNQLPLVHLAHTMMSITSHTLPLFHFALRNQPHRHIIVIGWEDTVYLGRCIHDRRH